MSDIDFVEKLAREWVDEAFDEYVSANQSLRRKGDSFRLGELRGRFESLDSFAAYLHLLKQFSREEFEMMKKL